MRSIFARVRGDCASAGWPLVWLAVGMLASTLYLYAAMLVRVEGHFTLPSPLFPPQAVILALLLLSAPRQWWVLLTAYYLVRVASGLINGIDGTFTLFSNIAGLLEPLAGALLVRRFVRAPATFDGLRPVILYVICVIAASVVGATLGAAVRLIFIGGPYVTSWRAWFLSDALASLLLTPAIVLWARADVRAVLTRRSAHTRLGEGFIAFSMLLVVSILTFTQDIEDVFVAPVLLYAPVPLLLWVGVRLGPLAMTSALAMFTVFAVGGVAQGGGPFVGRPDDASLLALQLFLFAFGVPLFIVAVLTEERRRAVVALAEGERRYRAFISSFPRGGVLLFGADQQHLLADGQGLPEMNLVKEEIEGKTPREAFSPELAATLQPHYESALAGEATSFDMLLNGRTYYTQVLPVMYAGSTAGMVVVQDVSEERRAKGLAELDRVKTAFFDDVSHEFRTPLALLLGPLEELLAQPDRLDPDARQQLVSARRNARRLLKLVNTLLDLSRLDAGRMQGTFRPTDLAAYTAELAAVFRSAIEHAGLQLTVDCPPVGEPIYVDRDQWEHIIFNLLSNALKFTAHGEIALRLRAHDDLVHVTVRDTGMGIPPAELPHVFERFHRVRGEQPRRIEGSGIGLSLVQDLVHMHGGRVTVDSVLGEGSAFTVMIPRGTAHLPPERIGADVDTPERSRRVDLEDAWIDSPEPTWAAARAPAQRDEDVQQTTRILVVDDNVDLRSYVARLLRSRGVVEAVGDGRVALTLARVWHPELIILDVMMPGMNGLDLLRAIRADPVLHAVAVLLLSGRAGDEERVEGVRAGADADLVKPFATAELLARVDSLLDMSRVRGEARAAAERRKLARDLHDSVTQTLYAAGVTADAAVALWETDLPQAREAVSELLRLTGAAQAEMRTLLLELRPEAVTHGLLHELLQTLARALAAKLPATIDTYLQRAPSLPGNVQEALYRIAQEALHNVSKHARPSRVCVTLDVEPRASELLLDAQGRWSGTLRMDVVDNGVGFDMEQVALGRLGMRSMRERAAGIGATISIESHSGGGTLVSVTWSGVSPARSTQHVMLAMADRPEDDEFSDVSRAAADPV